jgi:GNAT superfamily N-acetyltransferase
MNITIIRANIDDTPEILELQKIAYQKEAILYDDWTLPPLVQTLSEIQDECRNHVLLKAQLDARIVGSVRAFLDAAVCRIGRLFVHPEFQRQGIGALLIDTIEASFPHAERFELFTGTESTDNIRLYQKLGYKEYRQQDLSQKVRLVFMEKFNQSHQSLHAADS